MPNQNITMRAEAEANTYTITFDPNGGGEVTHIDDIIAQYDKQVSLPDATDYYVKYTQEGVNVTDAVLSGALSLSAEVKEGEQPGTSDQVSGQETNENVDEVTSPENEAEQSADQSDVDAVAEQPEKTPKVYPSVFLGWSLEAGKDSLMPQWKAGEPIDVKTLVEVAGVTDQNNATITLYAVWDDCPWIQATDLYYTLKQAQSGFITDTEILSHATAFDREDGSPIPPGFHENGTSFSIPDYAPTDFTQFQGNGSCTENLTVVDSSGSVYKKQITVHVVDTTAEAVKPEGTTRFINEYYYNQPYEYGGLRDDSIWKTDPEYVAVIKEAFENLKNNTPEASYYSTHEENLQMKDYIEEHGFGNSKEPDGLKNFYEKFMAPNKIK